MNVLVLGAAGSVGQLVLDEVLEKGHEVTALVTDASAVTMNHHRLTILQGDTAKSGDLERALQSQDAVVSAIGADSMKRDTVRSDLARRLVKSMKRRGVRKLVWLDGAGVGSSEQLVKRSTFFLERLLMRVCTGSVNEDAAAADQILEESDLDWVVVRPVALNDEPKKGKVGVVTDMSATLPSLEIPRADVAEFLARQVERNDYVKQMPVIHA